MKGMHILGLVLVLVLSPTSWAERTTSCTYTPEGLIETMDGPRNGATDVASFTHGSVGNPTTLTNTAGHSNQHIYYGSAGRLLPMVEPNGLVTSAAAWH